MRNILEDLKAKIQVNLMTEAPYFDYKDTRFNCYYHDYASPIDMQHNARIEILVPPELHIPNCHVVIQYEISTTRTEYLANRTSASCKLADYFVEEILPKVDFSLEKIKYERDVDRILSVL